MVTIYCMMKVYRGRLSHSYWCHVLHKWKEITFVSENNEYFMLPFTFSINCLLLFLHFAQKPIGWLMSDSQQVLGESHLSRATVVKMFNRFFFFFCSQLRIGFQKINLQSSRPTFWSKMWLVSVTRHSCVFYRVGMLGRYENSKLRCKVKV